jgi:ABC-type multidrug transport system fused ATPase/permease subunit
MPNYLETLRDFATEHPAMYALFVVTVMTHPVEKIVFPHVLSKTMSAITAGGKLPQRLIMTLVVLWVSIQVAYTGMNLLDTYMIPKFLDFARTRLIVDIMDSYETKFSDVMAGDLLSKIIKLPEALRDMFYLAHHGIFVDVVMHVFTVAYFYWLHPRLGHVYVAGIACWLAINACFFGACRTGVRAKESAQDALHEEIEDVLQNLLGVYINNKKGDEMRSVNLVQADYSSALKANMLCGVRFRALYAALVIGLFVCVIWTAVSLFQAGAIESSAFVATFMISFTAMGRLMSGFATVRNLQHELGVVGSVETFLNEVRVPKKRSAPASDAPRPPASASRPGAIRFEAVDYSKGGRKILDRMDVSIRGGVTTAIVGRVGSGKSTLVNLLMRLDVPDGGRITFEGRDVETYPLSQWRKSFAFVPQTPKLRNISLLDNVRYNGADASEADIDRVLREAGLTHVADSFKPRYREPVGVGGKSLSGGQRQVVWLLRSLLSDAPIVVMDEPTSALDPASRKDVIALLKSSFRGRTLIVVTHDADVRAMADDIVTFA